MFKILYLEDDIKYAQELMNDIADSSYVFTHIDTVDKLDEIGELFDFDLILSDLYVEDASHLDLLDKLDKFNIPIIVISNSTDARDELAVFSRNIQEYISKYSESEVIKLRIDNVIQNYTDKSLTYVLKNKQYKLVEESNVVIDHEGEVIFLTTREFKMLKYLLENRGKDVTRKELYFYAFYKEIYDAEQRVVDVYIAKIREKLKVNQIKSVRGIGYRWQD